MELHARGDARGDVPVGTSQDQDETVGERYSFAGHGEFVRPLEFFGKITDVTDGVRQDRIDREILWCDVVDGAKLHAAFPIEVEVQGTHERAGEIGARAGVFELRGTGMIVDDKGENEMVGEMRQRFGTAAENGAGIVVIDAFEIVEETRGGDAAGNAEARAVGDRAVGDQQNAAVVVPDGFFARW